MRKPYHSGVVPVNRLRWVRFCRDSTNILTSGQPCTASRTSAVGAPKDKGGDPALADKIGVFPMPSATAGQAMQSFSGGSDLAITAKSKNQNWAAAWVKEFTNAKSQAGLVRAGNVPNTTTLLDSALSDPKLAPFAASAKSSWFVPVDPNWSKVEKSLVLQNTLVEIVTGKVSVADGAKKLDEQINKLLNGA